MRGRHKREIESATHPKNYAVLGGQKRMEDKAQWQSGERQEMKEFNQLSNTGGGWGEVADGF